MIEEHPFGEAVPAEAVTIPDFDPHAGSRPKPKYVRNTNGKWVNWDRLHPEQEHMMPTSALAVKDDVPTVTTEQLDLIRRTVANGASADELKLYLFDCARQGVHPLDKLIHFTKRNGKYTPVTSIDFMRIRAADTGEYAGSDDASFSTWPGHDTSLPSQATVTVWRLVQGQRASFTATARWSEYKPDPGASGNGDVMWRKMPHTMLAKCAEALALRKGFPRQLSGLYAKEEMDQADSPHMAVVQAPTVPQSRGIPSKPNGGDSDSRVARPETLVDAVLSTGSSSDDGPDLGTAEPNDLPDGFRLIDDYKLDGDWHHVSWGRDAQGGWMVYKTKLAKIGLEAKTAFENEEPVALHSKKFPYLDKVERLGITRAQIADSKFKYVEEPPF